MRYKVQDDELISFVRVTSLAFYKSDFAADMVFNRARFTGASLRGTSATVSEFLIYQKDFIEKTLSKRLGVISSLSISRYHISFTRRSRLCFICFFDYESLSNIVLVIFPLAEAKSEEAALAVMGTSPRKMRA
jgi:hypothetical protein